MKYKYFSLGFLCAIVVGCTIGATMQVAPRQGNLDTKDLPFVTVVEINYSPPGLIPALEKSSNSFLNNINPGLSDELEIYRHNMVISSNGKIRDRIFYVKKQ